MDFIKPLGITEIIITSAFFIFYLLYLIRLNSINKKIKVYKRKVLFKLLLRSIYFFLLIISLLGPSFGDNKQEVNVVGVNPPAESPFDCAVITKSPVVPACMDLT